MRGRKEDEHVVEVVLLGQLQRNVEVGEDRLVNLGRGARLVAPNLPGIALEDPPAHDVDAVRLGVTEAGAETLPVVRMADPAVLAAAKVPRPVEPGDVSA